MADRTLPRRLGAALALPVLLAGTTTLAKLGDANATTAGFLYLLAVLAAATLGGWLLGAVCSVLATLCFNFFFLPPFGTFTIADPSNWVALACFLAASALVSRLVGTARRETAAADDRRREVEALYELSFGLFAALPGPGAAGEAAALTLRAIGARAGALLMGNVEGAPEGSLAPQPPIGDEPFAIEPELVRRAWREHALLAADGGETLYQPLEVGGHLAGVLVCRGATAGPAVREPAARLLALAIERARLHAEGAHLAAVRASEALLTSLLRAVSHDLRTPLTAMGMEIESLEQHLRGDALSSERLRSLARAHERLARRIDNLLSSARLEVGLARPHPEPTAAADLFRAARESLTAALDGRSLEVSVDRNCPELWVDPSLALETLVNLLENAARATPPGQTIELAAAGADGRVRLEVRDRGPGVPPAVLQLLAPLSDLGLAVAGGSGDSAAGGLGLRIARSFAEACGGSLILQARAGGGTVARLELPAATAGEPR